MKGMIGGGINPAQGQKERRMILVHQLGRMNDEEKTHEKIIAQ